MRVIESRANVCSAPDRRNLLILRHQICDTGEKSWKIFPSSISSSERGERVSHRFLFKLRKESQQVLSFLRTWRPRKLCGNFPLTLMFSNSWMIVPDVTVNNSSGGRHLTKQIIGITFVSSSTGTFLHFFLISLVLQCSAVCDGSLTFSRMRCFPFPQGTLTHGKPPILPNNFAIPRHKVHQAKNRILKIYVNWRRKRFNECSQQGKICRFDALKRQQNNNQEKIRACYCNPQRDAEYLEHGIRFEVIH